MLSILVSAICFSTNLRLSATITSVQIDTSSKQKALSSVARIFVQWQNDSPTNYYNVYAYDAYKLYLFAKDLNSASNWTQTSIFQAASNRGINYTFAHESFTYDSVTVSKQYHYDIVREIEITDDYISNFDPSSVSLYQNYLCENAFNEQYEQFDFVVRTEYTIYNGGGGYIYEVIPNLPGYETHINIDTYGAYKRYFSCDQSLYGYSSNYNPVAEIEYQGNVLVGDYNISIYDNDKVYITKNINSNTLELFMTKEQHYDRLYKTIPLEDDLTAWELIISYMSSFFHQLGEYSGDMSNLYNHKKTLASNEALTFNNLYYYYPYSSFERVFDSNGQFVTSPLVIGTFNYVDPSGGDGRVRLHWAYDVIPYLLWGNSPTDNSTIQERMIWDQASINPLNDNAKTSRGASLDSLYGYMINSQTYLAIYNAINNAHY